MNVLKFPRSTEKGIRLMESENTLQFSVDIKATKNDIRKAIEKTFNVKPIKINTRISPGGEKRAYVRFPPNKPVIDIATNLGLV